MFTKIIIAVLLVCSSLKATSQQSGHANIKFGKFSVVYKGLEYALRIRKDSSFVYIMRYEWPIKFTGGHWKIDKNVLVLRSIADTSNYDPSKGLRIGEYIMFLNERYKIRRNSLIYTSKPHMRLRFRRGED